MTDKRGELAIQGLVGRFSDELHLLVRALFPEQEPSYSRAVQFTASHFNEGVTSITLGLAVFMARMIENPTDIIVVEANFRDPSFRDILKLNGKGPIQKVLEGSCGLEDAVELVEKDAFAVLSAEKTHAEGDRGPSETMLANMKGLLLELKKLYRYVLVDSPPIIPFVDSAIMCEMVDGVIVVVESELTRAQVLDFALERLKSSGANILGTILNKRQFHIPRWLYRFL
jgi:Mrp family chromosome partitioning ATPase